MSAQFHWERETLKLYQTKLKGRLTILDQERQGLLQYLFIILFLVSFGIYHFVRNHKIVPVFFAGNIIFIIIIAVSFYQKYKKFRDLYKTKVVAELMQMVFPGSQFNHIDFVSQGDFLQSQLFRSRIDKYQGEDFVSGKIETRDFVFSELHVQRKEERYEKGRKRTHWVSVFKGLFYKTKLAKAVTSPIYILPDPSEEILGRWLGRMVGQWAELMADRGKAIELENPLFEKYYKVFCDNPILVRTILTPVAMELLTEFRQTAKRPIHISLVGDQLYLAISFGHDLFEPSLFSSMINTNELVKNLQALKVVEGLYKAIH
jgi:hypothetical protein